MSDAIPASVRKAIDNADNAYEDLCLHGGSQTEADNADRLRDEAILAALTAARQAARADALREAAAVCRERFGYFNARAENQAPGLYPQSLAYVQRDGAKECEYSILNLLITELTDE